MNFLIFNHFLNFFEFNSIYFELNSLKHYIYISHDDVISNMARTKRRIMITCYIYIIKHDFSCILKHK